MKTNRRNLSALVPLVKKGRCQQEGDGCHELVRMTKSKGMFLKPAGQTGEIPQTSNRQRNEPASPPPNNGGGFREIGLYGGDKSRLAAVGQHQVELRSPRFAQVLPELIKQGAAPP